MSEQGERPDGKTRRALEEMDAKHDPASRPDVNKNVRDRFIEALTEDDGEVADSFSNPPGLPDLVRELSDGFGESLAEGDNYSGIVHFLDYKYSADERDRGK